MKTQTEKKIEELNKSKVPIVIIDNSIKKEKTLFPEKLEQANEMLKYAKLPKLK